MLRSAAHAQLRQVGLKYKIPPPLTCTCSPPSILKERVSRASPALPPRCIAGGKAGEVRGELELSMGTRLDHPGLRSGEDTFSCGRLVSLLIP